MSKASNISSLSELRDRREEIKAEQEAARKGLTSTLVTAPAKAKEYALEDLALPALGIGLAAYVGYRLLRSGKKEEQWEQEKVDQRVPQPAPGPRPARTELASTYSAPAPPVQQPTSYREEETRKVVKSSLNFASLISAGKLLIPAAQAIISVVQNQRSKEQTEDQLHRP